ncbi:phage head morphogenesis protein [Flavobacterium covae]|uniref:phage head morphogenesis protein n=1 Tax=Flavobacterium covae TaxID=2906076 RepID=UPI000745ECAB|nr:phage minor head protein [Flavobacterium covae]AMA48975.1 hypothetical protein AWN65_05610 [Flavobacterium covae]MCJ1809894.1 phage head morphogenesis protein [Flavobacterium covae]
MFDERGISPENQQKAIQHYYDTLAKGVDIGYSPKPEMYDPALAHSLKYNIAQFSAFKETSFRKQLEALLVKDGNIVPWSEFKKAADALNIDYNRRWLETEYHHTVAVANMAEKWQDFEADADLYPNLKIVTAGDARVRDSHKVLDGIILPINHPFWKTHTVPFDWGCRCGIVQSDEEPSEKVPDFKFKKEFQNNPYYSGKIFKENPYLGGLEKTEIKEAKQNVSQFLESETNLINTKNSKVKISLGADYQDLKRNYQVADICSKKLNIDFLIRTHVDLQDVTNPEYLIFNKYLGDRKSIDGLNNMRGVIDSSKKQMLNKAVNPEQIPYYIVWDLDKVKGFDIDEIKRNLQRKITSERGRSIKGMIFQYKGKAAHLTREQIVKRDFKNLDLLK